MTAQEEAPLRPGSITPEDWTRIEPVLDRALATDPSSWATLLETGCGRDVRLRRLVESLLSRTAHLEHFLDALPAHAEWAAEGEPGRWMGRYRLLRRIARGGMGWVFLAERGDGLFQRRVAVKLLRPSLAGSDAAVRFESERRILATLDHPGIARLIDAGMTSRGRPYLVTEYVEGRPLDRVCREDRLSLRARLDLFEQVAEAVDHAHRNLLIHRDLKPSNILVTAEGRVKLLDFGVAKLLDPEPPQPPGTTTQTGRGWFTPGYAAPEQISGKPMTTAVDVYQLGALLYELLTDRRPFQDREAQGRRPLEEAILEQPPDPPSRRLSKGLRPLRRGAARDLDAIVLRALRKRPGDRYGSVRQLMKDIGRHRSGHPVRARRGTLRYRVGRFLRRHRIETLASLTAALALVMGTATAAWQARVARWERDHARDARAQAERACESSREITGALLEVLRASDPWDGGTPDPAAGRNLLRVGREQVEALGGQPALQAGLLEVLAQVHASYGELSEAEELARRAARIHRARGPGAALQVAESLNGLGMILRRRGRYAEADSMHRTALQHQLRSLGSDHPAVARTFSLLASQPHKGGLEDAEALHRRALAIRRATLGSSDPLVAESLGALGRLLRIQGRFDESHAAFRDALQILRSALGPDHPDVAGTMLSLADLHRTQGHLDRAEALYGAALRIQRRALGPAYPGLTHGLEGLAYVHRERGEDAEAEALLREGLELRREAFGNEHPAVAHGTGLLAEELHRQGRLDEAEALWRRELALLESTLGPNHWNLSGALFGLASVLADRGRFVEAEALQLRGLDIRREARGDRHGGLALGYADLARLKVRQDQATEAEQLYGQALEILLADRAPDHPQVQRIHKELEDLRRRTVVVRPGDDG